MDRAGAAVDARPAVRRKGLVIGWIDVHCADDHEEGEHEQFHRDHDVVGARALADA